uniref:Uncharacterized protein n=1 Tax=Anguilla anguilla TaxID=7936 RepID=A0A0E9Q0H7_ANGAN
MSHLNGLNQQCNEEVLLFSFPSR